MAEEDAALPETVRSGGELQLQGGLFGGSQEGDPLLIIRVCTESAHSLEVQIVENKEHIPALLADVLDAERTGGDVLLVLHNLNFEALGELCNDADYKKRVTFLGNTKEPTIRLRLSAGVDSLKQSRVFIDRYQSFCKS